MNKKKFERWTAAVLSGSVLCLILIALPTIIVDPVFHYHKPLENISYEISEPRYQNDGISKHFSYNALITGTSMTQRFLASEFDEMWGTTSIKVPYPGGSYQEIGNNILRAIENNEALEYVLWGLDTNRVTGMIEKDAISTTYRPEYLYDDNLFNDVEYLLNKDILLDYTLDTVKYTRRGNQTTSFDQYLNQDEEELKTGAEIILADYEHTTEKAELHSFGEENKKAVLDNIEQFIEPVVTKNEEIQFYLFFTPYSMVWWDQENSNGTVERYINAMRVAAEKLLEYENVEIYCFFDDYDMICDLDNYVDSMHYSPQINSQILKWIHTGEHRLEAVTYKEYFDELGQFYLSFDYDEYIEKNY